ncbi:MAG: cytidylate kinase [Thermoplasmata archaeon]|nr:MAG: cytidylate kinase [Thermoplasmata archaeon]RLF33578.1 MAG: cytidylate kinase [Thermoplasmata archaeon]
MTTITISGSPGSGKTTVAKLLEKKLGIKHIYTGEIFRKMAEEHNMSLQEFGSYCEKHREIDEQIDRYQLDVLKKGNVILEGRIAGWIAYHNNIPAIKILLDADLETRTKRIMKREDGTPTEKKQEILRREKSEAFRYKKYYNIDINDKSIYDLVIDSSHKTPDKIVDIITKKILREKN